MIPSNLRIVLNKLGDLEEYCSLPHAQKLQKAQELTDSTKLWEIYFSGCVLDPARALIEAELEAAPNSREIHSRAKSPIKLILKPIISSGQYGLQGQVTSLLLQNYGSLHASLLVGGAIVVEWGPSGVVIPSMKPISSTSASLPHSSARNGAGSAVSPPLSPSDIIEHEFEATIYKKEHVDKIISIVIQYNKSYIFDPIKRNCQTFISDILNKLQYPQHPRLEGNLGPYYDELIRIQKRPRMFTTHRDLDEHVQGYLEREVQHTAALEYLLMLYFKFHMVSLIECERPERWVCPHYDCLMPRLEARIDAKATLAYRLLH